MPLSMPIFRAWAAYVGSAKKRLASCIGKPSQRIMAPTPPPPEPATPDAAAMPRKLQTSGFHSYLNSAAKSSSNEIANMACSLQKKYRELDPASKKQMVTEFIKAGGKKAGMESTFQQSASSSQSSDAQGWAGYVTVGNLMEWSGVLWGKKSDHLHLGGQNCFLLPFEYLLCSGWEVGGINFFSVIPSPFLSSLR